MKSSNPHSGIYEADTTRTLDLNGGNPACNQGGMIVLDGFNLKENEKLSPTLTCQRIDTKNVPIVIEGNGQRDSHKGDGYRESDTMYTLNTVENHAICVGVDAYNQTETGDKSMSITGAATDSHHIPCVTVTQDAYDKYAENEKSSTLKQSGGNLGGERDSSYNQTVGSLCAVDYKGAGNQYVNNGKLIIQNIPKDSTP